MQAEGSGGRGSNLLAHSAPSGGSVGRRTTWKSCDLGLGTNLPGVESQRCHLLAGDLGSYSSFLCLSFLFCVTRIIVTLRMM